MKKILIISSSLRKGSNSEFLARRFEKGALEAGNETEFISLAGKSIAFCSGCMVCQDKQRCVIADDAREIAEKIKNADILVYATPVYYYGMSGQLKTLLDRLNPLYPADYRFREVYLIATAADGDESAVDITAAGIQGWLDCFPKALLKGVLRGTGIDGAGEAEEHTDLCEKAFMMGKGV